MPWWHATGSPLPGCRPGRASAPARRGEPRSCAPFDPTWRSSTSAGTSTPAWGWSPTPRSTRWSSRAPDWSAWVGGTAITEVIDPSVMVPAPGQGALAVEVRAVDGADRPLDSSLRTLDDPASRAAVTAERAVLAGLDAGCSAPVGALAVADEPGFAEPVLSLQAVVASVDGATIHRMSITAPLAEAAEAGHTLALRLLASADAVITGDVAR